MAAHENLSFEIYRRGDTIADLHLKMPVPWLFSGCKAFSITNVEEARRSENANGGQISWSAGLFPIATLITEAVGQAWQPGK